MYKLTVEFESLAELKNFLAVPTTTTIVVPPTPPVAKVPTPPVVKTEVEPPASNTVPKKVTKAAKTVEAEKPAPLMTEGGVTTPKDLSLIAIRVASGNPEKTARVKKICEEFGIDKLARAKPEQVEDIKALLLELE